jgi:ABC-type antimicrobial peptide transport system permease subunit
MFFFKYAFSELRRRRGRTILTALGLAVGVALVVMVSGLTTGLNNAQAKVLKPLTGIGTDMSVSRPIKVNTSSRSPFASLSPAERQQLRGEAGRSSGFNFSTLKPGAKIDTDTFVPAGDLTFPSSELTTLGKLSKVKAVAGSLTLNDVHISGTIPKISIHQTFTPGSVEHVGGGGHRRGGGFAFRTPGSFSRASGTFGGGAISSTSRTITGIDPSKPSLAQVAPSQIVKGSYFTSTPTGDEAIVSQGYANQEKLSVGSKLTIDGKTFDVIGIASSPLGGTASDVYVKLATLQKLAGYKGQVDTAEVQAASASDVNNVSSTISKSFKSSQVTTASDLAARTSGSLNDAKNLAHNLGGALELVGLVAAVLIASLLMLASVARRVREIGTLKAVGWSRFQVVRQICGEALGQGILGGVLGVIIGVVGIAVLNAAGWTLKATVPAASSSGSSFGLGAIAQSAVTTGSTAVKITAVASVGLVIIAVALALLASLVAGAIASFRAARLRPAAALRTIE